MHCNRCDKYVVIFEHGATLVLCGFAAGGCKTHCAGCTMIISGLQKPQKSKLREEAVGEGGSSERKRGREQVAQTRGRPEKKHQREAVLIDWFAQWLRRANYWIILLLIHSFICWFIHSLIGSFIEFIPSFIHWLTWSLIHALIPSLFGSPIHWSIGWVAHSLIHWLVRIHWFIHSLLHPFLKEAHWFTSSLTHQFTHALIQWFLRSLVQTMN